VFDVGRAHCVGIEKADLLAPHEVVDEEVFPASHQFFGNIAGHVEAEVPASALRDVHRFFLTEARQTAFDEDEVADLLRPLCGVGVGDVPTQIMADERDA
jgi:hypothetical protein